MRTTSSAWMICLLGVALASAGCGGGTEIGADTGTDVGATDDGGRVDGGSTDGGRADGGAADGGAIDGGGADAGPAPGPAILEVTLPVGGLDFGAWTCASSPPASRSVTVRNVGESVGAFAVTTSDDTWYALTGATRGALAPGEELSFSIAPRAALDLEPGFRSDGVRYGRFDVVPLGDALGGLTLNPTVTRAGAFAFIPEGAFDLGEIAIGASRGAVQTLANFGTMPIDVTLHASIEGPFTFTLDGAPITAALTSSAGVVVTLDPDPLMTGSPMHTIVATYTPTAAGSHRARVSFDLAPGLLCASNVGDFVVTGTATSSSLLVGGDVVLGETACGSTASPGTISLRNAGTTTAVSWAAVTGLGSASPYTVFPTSGTIAAGGSDTIMVTPRAAPDSALPIPLSYDDVVVVTRTDLAGEDPRVVGLHQTVGGALLRWVDSRPTSLYAAVGENASASYTLENTGTQSADVTFASDSTSVTLSPASATLPAGARVTVVATYRPTATDPARSRGYVRAATTSPLCQTLDYANDPELTLTVRTDALRVGTTAVDFGHWACDPGGTPAPALVPVTNTSAGPVTFTVPVATTDDFTVRRMGGAPLSASGETIAAGQTVFLEVVPTTRTGEFYDVNTSFTIVSGASAYGVAVHVAQVGAELVGTSTPSTFDVGAGARFPFVATYFNSGNRDVQLYVQERPSDESQLVTFPAGESTSIAFYPATSAIGVETHSMHFSHTLASHTALCSGLPPDYLLSVNVTTTDVTSVDTLDLAFGDSPCGGVPPGARFVTITNPSSASVTYSADLISSSARRFDVSPLSGTIPANGTERILVTPLAVRAGLSTEVVSPGAVEDTLVVTTTTASHTIALHETVRGVIVTRSSPTVELASTQVGETTWNGAGFSILGNVPTTLVFAEASDPMNEIRFAPAAAGTNPPYAAVFSPAMAGARSFEATVGVAAGTPVCAPLPVGPTTYTGQGLATFAVDLSASLVDFGFNACGSMPSNRGFAITNSGTAPVTFAIEYEAGHWVTASPASGTIAAGASQVVTLVSSRVPTDLPESTPGVFTWREWDHSHIERLFVTVPTGTATARLPLDVSVVATGQAYDLHPFGTNYVDFYTTSFPIVGGTHGVAYTITHSATDGCLETDYVSNPTGSNQDFTWDCSAGGMYALQVLRNTAVVSDHCMAGATITYP